MHAHDRLLPLLLLVTFILAACAGEPKPWAGKERLDKTTPEYSVHESKGP